MKKSFSKRSTRTAGRPKSTDDREEGIMISSRSKGFFEPLDDQEREIRDAIEKGKLVSVSGEEELKEMLVKAARATIAKNRHISIRLSERDLMRLRAKALELGMPYQTLIGSILHQYAEGKVKASF
jgi:predicted DNA binding CopG/RHH family protein